MGEIKTNIYLLPFDSNQVPVSLPTTDIVLSDFLEERGYVKAAETLRTGENPFDKNKIYDIFRYLIKYGISHVLIREETSRALEESIQGRRPFFEWTIDVLDANLSLSEETIIQAVLEFCCEISPPIQGGL